MCSEIVKLIAHKYQVWFKLFGQLVDNLISISLIHFLFFKVMHRISRVSYTVSYTVYNVGLPFYPEFQYLDKGIQL